MNLQDDLYSKLKVSPDADTEVIKAAYRALTKKYHPDTGGSESDFISIQTAYEILSDPIRRAKYDSGRAGQSHARQSDTRESWQHDNHSGGKTSTKPPPPEQPQRAREYDANIDQYEINIGPLIKSLPKFVVPTLVSAAIVTFVITNYLNTLIASNGSEINYVNLEISRVAAEMENERQILLKRKEQKLGSRNLDFEAIANTLNDIRASTPANLWLSSLDFGSVDNITIAGNSLDYSSVTLFQRNLANSRLIDSAILGKSDLRTDNQGVSSIVFSIDVKIKGKH